MNSKCKMCSKYYNNSGFQYCFSFVTGFNSNGECKDFTQRGDMINELKHPKKITMLEIVKARLNPEQYEGFLLGNLMIESLKSIRSENSVSCLDKIEMYTSELKKIRG